jgi:hypothetical protein
VGTRADAGGVETVSERLTDEQVADWIALGEAGDTPTPMSHVLRELQQWRALIPEVIEQLDDLVSHMTGPAEYGYRPLTAIIAKLREASQ